MDDYFSDDPGNTQYVQTIDNESKGSNSSWVWLVFAVSAVAIIIGILILVWRHQTITSTSSQTVPPQCSSLTSTLPDVSNIPCCDNTLNKRYTSADGSLSLIVGPTAQPASSVCTQFCAVGATFDPTTNTCSAFPAGSGNSAQTSFNNCISSVEAVGCTGEAKPIVTNNGVPYYAQAAGTTCTTQTTCPAS